MQRSEAPKWKSTPRLGCIDTRLGQAGSPGLPKKTWKAKFIHVQAPACESIRRICSAESSCSAETLARLPECRYACARTTDLACDDDEDSAFAIAATFSERCVMLVCCGARPRIFLHGDGKCAVCCRSNPPGGRYHDVQCLLGQGAFSRSTSCCGMNSSISLVELGLAGSTNSAKLAATLGQAMQLHAVVVQGIFNI